MHIDEKDRGLASIILHRGDRRDLVSLRLPVLAARMAIHEAFRAAVGYVDGDEDEPSGTPNGSDLVAVMLAALGVAYVSGIPDHGFGTLRDHKRDVVAYGEHVQDRLWRLGYRDPSSQIEECRAIREWISSSLLEEAAGIAEAAADFSTAPGRSRVAGAH